MAKTRAQALDLCARLKALADRAATPGEREAAERRLTALRVRYGIADGEQADAPTHAASRAVRPLTEEELVESFARIFGSTSTAPAGSFNHVFAAGAAAPRPGEGVVYVKGPPRPGMTHVHYGGDDYRRIIWTE